MVRSQTTYYGAAQGNTLSAAQDWTPHWLNGRLLSVVTTGAGASITLPSTTYARAGARYFAIYNEAGSTDSLTIYDANGSTVLNTLAVDGWAKVYCDDSGWLVF